MKKALERPGPGIPWHDRLSYLTDTEREKNHNFQNQTSMMDCAIDVWPCSSTGGGVNELMAISCSASKQIRQTVSALGSTWFLSHGSSGPFVGGCLYPMDAPWPDKWFDDLSED